MASRKAHTLQNGGREPKRARRERARAARRFQQRQRSRRRFVSRAIVAAALVVTIGGLGLVLFRGSVSPSGTVSFSGDFRVGGTIKSLTLPALAGGGSISYSQFDNRPLVLNFFASWCPFCIREMPAFQQVHRQLGNRVAFLGVSQRDQPHPSLSLARQTGVTYPTAIDEQGRFFDAIGAGGMPTTLFVKPGGQIAYIQVGPLDASTLTHYVHQYLGVSV